MSGKLSYAKIEKTFVHQLRSAVSQSENTTEVINYFSQIAGAFLRAVFEERFDLYDRDVIFDKTTEGKFRFSDNLMKNGEFVKVISASDILDIIGRFALVAEHRMTHLDKHSLKSDLKIRAQMVA